jgi:amidase
MAKLDDLAFLDATALAGLVSQKMVKATELVEASLERVERLNPTLNAVVTPMYEQALAAAKADAPRGPFSGVPFLLKDLVASYGGVPFTHGSAFLRDYIPKHDSELVVRLRKAGLIIIGKTNTSEFGILPTTEPSLHGPTRNPWDIDRTSGGSSGGSAAAVAAGLVPMAHANDSGGSIRIPASCCAVFGLKPTRARNPLGPDFGDVMSGLVAEHALTRSVRDSAALLDATSGADVGDPYCAPAPRRPFLQEVGEPPVRLRVAVSTKANNGAPIHQDCIDAVEDAAALCADLGHQVTDAAPPVNAELMGEALTTVQLAACTSTIDRLSRVTARTPTRDQFEPLTWALYELGRRRTASEYLLALDMLQKIARDVARFFENYDLWLTPTLSEPPVPLGTFASPNDNPAQGLLRAGAFAPFTSICNITGQPAMSLPLFWNANGLPVGVHFVGRFGDEATLFRLAAQLEIARPWAHRHPDLPA